MKDILLITPPFTQLNTPYPATAYLKGFLNDKGVSNFQVDLGIEVILQLFSKEGIIDLFSKPVDLEKLSKNAYRINKLKEAYINTIDEVMHFLQGKNPSLAWQICNNSFLPQASRFDTISDLDWAFGSMGFVDKAKHLATLYLEDLSDYISECIDPNFGFSRYAERIGRSANSFDELHDKLQGEYSYIDKISISLFNQKLDAYKPKLICLSVPFPGNLFSAFRCAQYVKQNFPDIKILMGGGFPTTELRSITDPRVFDFFDYITLDDGELPIEQIYNHLFSELPSDKKQLCRTFCIEKGQVFYKNDCKKKDYKQNELGAPSYEDLLINQYISVIEMTNPMHSLWSDGRWNKLTMAHGCYWGKCTFCDGSLNYIGHHDPNTAKALVDRMELLIKETGERGFHFVDEAAPPVLMRELALEIIRRELNVTWWTNIRFERSFSEDLCILLKSSGCIAISGGLEVASDRMLKLINKGVTVEQVAKVTNNLSKAGIMVHAYLMYGFPSQTIQETIDSVEMVRQFFELGIIQSAYWHQFALTAHSPVGLNPKKYNIKPKLKRISFANNDIEFSDNTRIDHDAFSYGLKKSLYNFMHDFGFDMPVHEWFAEYDTPFKIPRTKIKPSFIQNSLHDESGLIIKPNAKVIWLGSVPSFTIKSKSKKGRVWENMVLTLHEKTKSVEIVIDKEKGEWLLKIIPKIQIQNASVYSISDLKESYEQELSDFELFWYSKPMNKLKGRNLLQF